MCRLLYGALALVMVTWGSAMDIEDALEMREHASRIQGVVDECLDSVVELYQEFAEDQGLDPQELADRMEGFSMQVLLSTWEEDLDLDGDWLDELMIVSGAADGTFTVEHKVARLTDDLQFDDLLVSYLYLAKIMNMGHMGNIFQQVEELKIMSDIEDTTGLWFTHIQNQNTKATERGLSGIQSTAIYRAISRLFRALPLKLLCTITRRSLETTGLGHWARVSGRFQ